MIVKLNDELRHALNEQGEQPIEVLDPGTNRVYVLVAREHYDRLRLLFDPDPMSHEEQRHLLRESGRRAGWDDPEMDTYDRYDEVRPPQS